MISLASILHSLDTSVLETCTLHDLDYFLWVCVYFKPELELFVPLDSEYPPHSLPHHFSNFLIGILLLDSLTVSNLWRALKDVIWKKINLSNIYLTASERTHIDYIGSKSIRKEDRLGTFDQLIQSILF